MSTCFLEHLEKVSQLMHSKEASSSQTDRVSWETKVLYTSKPDRLTFSKAYLFRFTSEDR